MKLNWNFPGVLGCKTKNLPWGEYGYFLELHIFFASAECLDSLHASLSSMLGLRHQQHIHDRITFSCMEKEARTYSVLSAN